MVSRHSSPSYAERSATQHRIYFRSAQAGFDGSHAPRDSYSGEAKHAPEAFLAQFRLFARQNSVPDTERARQLIGKLTGPAQLWNTLTFANDPTTATEAQIALGLRKAFGQEYAGVRALRAIFHVTAQPTQSGAQRLLALDQREEQVS